MDEWDAKELNSRIAQREAVLAASTLYGHSSPYVQGLAQSLGSILDGLPASNGSDAPAPDKKLLLIEG